MKVIKFAHNSTDIRIVYAHGRPIATIERLEIGKYRVVKLFEKVVWDCSSYTEAREVALNSATIAA